MVSLLESLPAFVNVIKASIPKKLFETVLSQADNAKLTSGAVKLMQKKDGSLIATLVDPTTKKMLKHVPIKEINIAPEMANALNGLSMQMQMAQIMNQLENIQQSMGEVLIGLENDRLALAFSSEQKYLQAIQIHNPELKQEMLLRIGMDAEDCRNQLMLSQKENMKYISNQPKSFWEKLTANNVSIKKIDEKLGQIRAGLKAINLTSMVEVMVYKELGEFDSALKSLEFYSEHIQKTFFTSDGIIHRLESLDKNPQWVEQLNIVRKNIFLLNNSFKLIETGKINAE